MSLQIGADFLGRIGQNCPKERSRIHVRSVPSITKASVASIFRGGIETRGNAGQHKVLCARQWKVQARRLLARTTTPQCVLTDPRLPSPAREILDYLARHPDAQDTMDGILHWWVLEVLRQKWAPRIAETVAQLVEQGFLEEKRSSDGKIFYHVSPALSLHPSGTASTKLYSDEIP